MKRWSIEVGELMPALSLLGRKLASPASRAGRGAHGDAHPNLHAYADTDRLRHPDAHRNEHPGSPAVTGNAAGSPSGGCAIGRLRAWGRPSPAPSAGRVTTPSPASL